MHFSGTSRYPRAIGFGLWLGLGLRLFGKDRIYRTDDVGRDDVPPSSCVGKRENDDEEGRREEEGDEDGDGAATPPRFDGRDVIVHCGVSQPLSADCLVSMSLESRLRQTVSRKRSKNTIVRHVERDYVSLNEQRQVRSQGRDEVALDASGGDVTPQVEVAEMLNSWGSDNEVKLACHEILSAGRGRMWEC